MLIIENLMTQNIGIKKMGAESRLSVLMDKLFIRYFLFLFLTNLKVTTHFCTAGSGSTSTLRTQWDSDTNQMNADPQP